MSNRKQLPSGETLQSYVNKVMKTWPSGVVTYRESWAVKQMMEHISKELHDIIKQAYMDGQSSAGVDPSYSEALEYCENITIDSGADAQQEIDKLKAHNELLREALCDIRGELYGKGFEVNGWHLNGDTELLDNWFDDNDWFEAIDETSAQSLTHIKAQVEEETIERCRDIAEQLNSKYNIVDIMKVMPRKYKEQFDE